MIFAFNLICNQLYEINSMINEFNKSNRPGDTVNKTFRILNELKT